MESTEKSISILSQIWIFTAALKTLFALNVHNKYSAQVDMTIDNLRATSLMLLAEARRQQDNLKCQ